MFNLTRSQARQRAQTVSVSHIDVTVDLTRAGDLDETHYPVTSVFTMTLNRPSTFVDVVGTVDEVLVDDAPHAFHHDGSRLDLDDLPISRPITLTVRAHCSFSRTGEGLHRYLDPEDHRIYLYTQFEPTDARRAWPCMDQPDINLPRPRAERMDCHVQRHRHTDGCRHLHSARLFHHTTSVLLHHRSCCRPVGRS